MKKIKTLKTKKADVTTPFIVTIILLILGFAVLLYFYFQLNPSGTIDKTVCKNSVVIRASTPELIQNYLPLNCKTEKICISSGLFKKGECQEFIGETGITNLKAKNLDQIEKLYAQKLVECWEMMGEGKLSLFNRFVMDKFGLGSDVYPTCVICSRIAFDKKTLESLNLKAEDIDIQGYMLTHKMPGKDITYFEYLAGKNAKYSILENDKIDNDPASLDSLRKSGISESEIQESIALKKGRDIDSIKEDVSSSLNLENQATAILFMQISAPKQGDIFKNWFYANLAFLGLSAKYSPGSFFRVPTYTSGGAELWKGTVYNYKGYWKGSFGITPLAKVYAAISVTIAAIAQINTVWQRSVTAGYCGDISMGTESRDGCSVIRVIPYEEESISSYCSVIESIP